MPVGALGAGLILGGIQTATGLIQRGSAANRRKKAMADMRYDIPSATKEQLQLARERASQTGLPGEDITRSRMEANVAQGVSKGESVAGTSSDVLGMYQNMYGNKMDMNRQILEKGAQYKSENELQLQKSMGLMAEAESQQFYYNKMVPFLSEMGYAGEQAQGGSANIAGGLQTAYQVYMNNFMTKRPIKEQGTEGVDFGRKKAENIAGYGKSQDVNGWQSSQPWQSPERTELSPWADTNGGQPNGWQNIPEWQKNNPVQYPPSWLKYNNGGQ